MKRLMTYCLCAVTMALCLSCGSDDETLRDDLLGTWYGIFKYKNPVSGTKYHYLDITLNENKTFHLSEKKYANKDAKEKSGAWSVEGNEITLTVKGTEFLTGELNGTTLTFESAGQKTVLKK